MNPHGISHHLFVAALAQESQALKRATSTRVERGAVKIRSNRSAQPANALAARRLSEWSWSGWHYPTT
jgi:hypothetical protein